MSRPASSDDAALDRILSSGARDPLVKSALKGLQRDDWDRSSVTTGRRGAPQSSSYAGSVTSKRRDRDVGGYSSKRPSELARPPSSPARGRGLPAADSMASMSPTATSFGSPRSYVSPRAREKVKAATAEEKQTNMNSLQCLVTTIEDKTQEAGALQKAKTRLEGDVKRLEKDCDKAKEEALRRKEKQRALEAERKRLADQLAGAEAEADSLRKKYAKAKEEVKRGKARLDDQEAKALMGNDEAQRELARMKKDLRRLQDENADLKRQLGDHDELGRDAVRFKRQIEQLERTCEVSEAKTHTLTTANDGLKDEVTALQRQLEEVQSGLGAETATLVADNRRLRAEVHMLGDERAALDRRLEEERRRRFETEKELAREVEKVRDDLGSEIERLQRQLQDAERAKSATETRLQDERYDRGVNSTELERELAKLRHELAAAKTAHADDKSTLEAKVSRREADFQALQRREARRRASRTARAQRLQRALEAREKAAMLLEDRAQQAVDAWVEKNIRPTTRQQHMTACQDELMQDGDALQALMMEARERALEDIIARYVRDTPKEVEREARDRAAASLCDVVLQDPAVIEAIKEELIRDRFAELHSEAQKQVLCDLKREALSTAAHRENITFNLVQELLRTNEADLRDEAWKRAQASVAESEGDALCEQARAALYTATYGELKASEERAAVSQEARAALLTEERAALAADGTVMRLVQDDVRQSVAAEIKASLTDGDVAAVREQVLRALEKDLTRAEGRELLETVRRNVVAECEERLRADPAQVAAVREEVSAKMQDDLARAHGPTLLAEAKEQLHLAAVHELRGDRRAMEEFRSTAEAKLLHECLTVLSGDEDALARLRQDAVTAETRRLLDTDVDVIRAAARRLAEEEVLKRDGRGLCDDARAELKKKHMDDMRADLLLMEALRREARDGLVALEAGDLRGCAEVRQLAVERAVEQLPRAAVDKAATEQALKTLAPADRDAARHRAVIAHAEALRETDKGVHQDARESVIQDEAAALRGSKQSMRELRAKALQSVCDRILEEDGEELERAAQEKVAREHGPVLCQEARTRLFEEVRDNLREDRSAMAMLKSDARRDLAAELQATDAEVQKAARADAVRATKDALLENEPDTLRAAAAALLHADPEVRALAVAAVKADPAVADQAAAAFLEDLRRDPARLRAVQERAFETLFHEAMQDDAVAAAARDAAQRDYAAKNAGQIAEAAREALVSQAVAGLERVPAKMQEVEAAAVDAVKASLQDSAGVRQAAMDKLVNALMQEEGALLKTAAQREVQQELRAEVQRDPAEMLSLKHHAVEDVIQQLQGDRGVRDEARAKAVALLTDREGPALTREARGAIEADLRAALRNDPEELARLQEDAVVVVAQELRAAPATRDAAKARAAAELFETDGAALCAAARAAVETRLRDELENDPAALHEARQAVADALEREFRADAGLREAIRNQVVQELMQADPAFAAEARRHAEAQAHQDIRRSAAQMEDVHGAALARLVDEFSQRADLRSAAEERVLARFEEEISHGDERALRAAARDRAVARMPDAARAAVEREARQAVYDGAVEEVRHAGAEAIAAAAQERLVQELLAADAAGLKEAARREVRQRMVAELMEEEELLLRAAARKAAEEKVAARDGDALCAEAREGLLQSAAAELRQHSMDAIHAAAEEHLVEELLCDTSRRGEISEAAKQAAIAHIIAEGGAALRDELLPAAREEVAARERGVLLEEARASLLSEALGVYRDDAAFMAAVHDEAQRHLEAEVLAESGEHIKKQAFLAVTDTIYNEHHAEHEAAAKAHVEADLRREIRSDPAAMRGIRSAAVVAVQAELAEEEWDALLAEARAAAQREAEAKIMERDGGELMTEACERVLEGLAAEVRADDALVAGLRRRAAADAAAAVFAAGGGDAVLPVLACVASHLSAVEVLRDAIEVDLARQGAAPRAARVVADHAGEAYERVLRGRARWAAAAADGAPEDERVAAAQALLPHLHPPEAATTAEEEEEEAEEDEEARPGGSGSPLRHTELRLLRHAIAANRNVEYIAALVPRAEETVAAELAAALQEDEEAMARARDAAVDALCQEAATDPHGFVEKLPLESRDVVLAKVAEAHAAAPDGGSGAPPSQERAVAHALAAHVMQHRHAVAEATAAALEEFRTEPADAAAAPTCVGDVFPSLSLQEQLACTQAFAPRAERAGRDLVAVAVDAKAAVVAVIKQGLGVELIARGLQGLAAADIAPPPPVDQPDAADAEFAVAPAHRYLSAPPVPHPLATEARALVVQNEAVRQLAAAAAVRRLRENHGGEASSDASSPGPLLTPEGLRAAEPQGVAELERRADGEGVDAECLLREVADAVVADIEGGVRRDILARHVADLEPSHLHIPAEAVAAAGEERAAPTVECFVHYDADGRLEDASIAPPLSQTERAAAAAAARRLRANSAAMKRLTDAAVAGLQAQHGAAPPGALISLDGADTAALLRELEADAAAAGCAADAVVAQAQREVVREIQAGVERELVAGQVGRLAGRVNPGGGGGRYVHYDAEGRLDDDFEAPQLSPAEACAVEAAAARLREHPTAMAALARGAVVGMQDGAAAPVPALSVHEGADVAVLLRELEADAAAAGCAADAVVAQAQREVVRGIQRDIERELAAGEVAKLAPEKIVVPVEGCAEAVEWGRVAVRGGGRTERPVGEQAVVRSIAGKLRRSKAAMQRITAAAVDGLKGGAAPALVAMDDAFGADGGVELAVFAAEFNAKAKVAGAPLGELYHAAQLEVAEAVQQSIRDEIVAREVADLDPGAVAPPPPGTGAHHYLPPKPPPTDRPLLPHEALPELAPAQRPAAARVAAALRRSSAVMRFATEAAVAGLQAHHAGAAPAGDDAAALGDLLEDPASGVDMIAVHEAAHAAGCPADVLLRYAHSDIIRDIQRGVAQEVLAEHAPRIDPGQVRAATTGTSRSGARHRYLDLGGDAASSPHLTAPERAAAAAAARRLRANSAAMKRLTDAAVAGLQAQHGAAPPGAPVSLDGADTAALLRELEADAAAAGCAADAVVAQAQREVVREIQAGVERELVAGQVGRLAGRVNPGGGGGRYVHYDAEGRLDDDFEAPQLSPAEACAVEAAAAVLKDTEGAMALFTEAAVVGMQSGGEAVLMAAEDVQADPAMAAAWDAVKAHAAAAGCPPEVVLREAQRAVVDGIQRGVRAELVAAHAAALDPADVAPPPPQLTAGHQYFRRRQAASDAPPGVQVRASVLATDSAAGNAVKAVIATSGVPWKVLGNVHDAARVKAAVCADVAAELGVDAACVAVTEVARGADGGATFELAVRGAAAAPQDLRRVVGQKVAGAALRKTAAVVSGLRGCRECATHRERFEAVVEALRVELDAANLQLELSTGGGGGGNVVAAATQTDVTLTSSLHDAPGARASHPRGRRTSTATPRGASGSVRSISAYSAATTARSFSASHLPRRAMPRPGKARSAAAPRRRGPEPAPTPASTLGCPMHMASVSVASPWRVRGSPDATPGSCSSSVRRRLPTASEGSVSPYLWVHPPGKTKPLSPPRLPARY